MLAVKVLPKGQITLPKEVRQKLHIQVGDTLLMPSSRDSIRNYLVKHLIT